MSELYSSVKITSVTRAISDILGIKCAADCEEANPALAALAAKKLGGARADRAVLYNPDAVALWIFQKYTRLFTDALLASDISLPMLSVMPSVTPVCFGSMYTGVMPAVHGIQKYEKPVLRRETLFDSLIAAGKKPAIISTGVDSISRIFLEREMDYFIYDTPDEVNAKALELIDADVYDVLVIYNGNYDGTMHKFGPESAEALAALEMNVAFYAKLIAKIKSDWKKHSVVYGFMPDHGCHEIDGGCGAHGLDMQEDMNIVHMYGVKPAE